MRALLTTTEEADAITFDLSCTRCGYNLRALSPTGICPECSHRILDSVEEHIRRRTASRVDQTRFADRSAESLRSIRDGAAYALVANGIGASAFFIQPWMLARHSASRVVLLVLLSVAIASAAVSIWKFGTRPTSPLHRLPVSGWLLRIGGVAAVAYPVVATLSYDRLTFGVSGPHTYLQYTVIAAAWALAMGASLRLIYVQWWLRLEGHGLIGWPVLLSMLPVAAFYLFAGMDRAFYRGEFIGLEFFMETPLASGSWPEAMHSAPRILRFARGDELLLFALLLLGHAIVLIADGMLFRLAHWELAQRSRPAATALGHERDAPATVR